MVCGLHRGEERERERIWGNWGEREKKYGESGGMKRLRTKKKEQEKERKRERERERERERVKRISEMAMHLTGRYKKGMIKPVAKKDKTKMGKEKEKERGQEEISRTNL